jgi:hypothetical protein
VKTPNARGAKPVRCQSAPDVLVCDQRVIGLWDSDLIGLEGSDVRSATHSRYPS